MGKDLTVASWQFSVQISTMTLVLETTDNIRRQNQDLAAQNLNLLRLCSPRPIDHPPSLVEQSLSAYTIPTVCTLRSPPLFYSKLTHLSRLLPSTVRLKTDWRCPCRSPTRQRICNDLDWLDRNLLHIGQLWHPVESKSTRVHLLLTQVSPLPRVLPEARPGKEC